MELLSHAGDQNYENAALVVDGMSLKEMAEFDPHIKQVHTVFFYSMQT